MSFQFVLPSSNGDLLNSSGDNYYVKHVYSPTEFPEKLRECKQMVFQGDPFYVFDHFDTYFTVIMSDSIDQTTITNLMRSFDLLYLTTEKLGERLAPLLATGEMESTPERVNYLNLVKMTMFLYVSVVKKIEHAMQKLLQQQQQNQAKKRGKNADTVDQYSNWDGKRNKFLIQLYNFVQFPLEKLWNPPIADENFVNLICDICYRILEILYPRQENRSVGDTIFQIFGKAIKRYNHALTFPVRILQILRNTETAATFVANGIVLLYEEFNISTIFSLLIKDIVDALTLDSADSAVSRNFSNFLSELAGVGPKMMIPHLSMLGEELLNCESHILRNCILQIMGEAIIGELTSEELNDEMKEARNEFLENLLAHINDVSAHVRAKVLQIWNHMKEVNSVPLSFQLKVLREAVDRLEDKTAIVRKQAVQLIKAFLEQNPFSAKLTLKELMKKHEEEVLKMEMIREQIEEERKKADDLDEQWTTVVPLILPFIRESLEAGNENIQPGEIDKDDIIKMIGTLMIEKKFKEAVALVRKADILSGNDTLVDQLAFDDKIAYFTTLLRSYLFLANGCKDSQEEYGTQIKTVEFLQDSIEFSRVITRAVPKVQELLLSKTTSDVFEAVDFFTTGYLFGIKGTECGMQQLLYLVWSSDKEKREAISNAYKKVLFTTDQTGRTHAIKVVQNLSKFLEEIEYGHFIAFECLIREWVASDDIDALIVQVLFERYSMKLEGTTKNESRLALQLLVMASQQKSSIAAANINVIETIGLGERGLRDPRLYASSLEFLRNSIDSTQSTKFYKRYEPDNSIIQKIITNFQNFFFHPGVPDFDKLAISALEVIYHMCQTPDKICENIIINLLKKFQDIAVKDIEITASQQVEAMETPFSQQIPDSQPTGAITQISSSVDEQRIPTFLLTRFIFIIGFMALKEMIFLDIDVYNNMKYRQELTECEKKNKKQNAAFNANIRRTGSNINMSAMESLKRLSGSAAEQQEPDEELVGATAEDNIAELINHICENVLLHDDHSLLGKIVPFVLEICKYPAKYRDANLQQAATLTLIRFMTISMQFCEKYMSFLMNILNQTKNIKIKCNIVIGLSDLTFRFPNVIEPWTGHFYSTLHETNTELRLTAVKMLSHLILHEMIRVKGQIADLAMCIVDPEDEIRNITQQFFKEIANKSNILYNVLPDIISKLSDTNLNLEEEKYHNIMRYILSLIQKDRQVETLVEKLCLRFSVTREERQWRDVAYCLSLLTYNERSLKKLIDNIQHYKDKVQIDEVHQSFKTIISSTGKSAKPELKIVLTEFETRLNECLEINHGGGGDGAQQTKNRTKSSTLQKSSRRGRTRNTRNQTSSSDSDSDSEEEDNRRGKKGDKKGDKKGGKKNVKYSDESSSSASSAETESLQPPARKAVKKAPPKPAPKSQRSRQFSRIVEEENSPDDDDEESGNKRQNKSVRKRK